MGGWFVVLVDQNERGNVAGSAEQVAPEEIGDQRVGSLTVADRKRRVANHVEVGVADIVHIENTRAGADHSPGVRAPGDTQSWAKVVVIGLLIAAAKTAVADVRNTRWERIGRIAFKRIAAPGPHISRKDRAI